MSVILYTPLYFCDLQRPNIVNVMCTKRNKRPASFIYQIAYYTPSAKLIGPTQMCVQVGFPSDEMMVHLFMNTCIEIMIHWTPRLL